MSDEVTVPNNRTPIEQLLDDVGEMRREQREARVVLDRIASNQLRFDETLKNHGERLTVLERERRLPQVALFVIAAVAIVAMSLSFVLSFIR